MYTLGIHFAISGFKILALILLIVLFQVLTIRQYGTCCPGPGNMIFNLTISNSNLLSF